MATIDPVTQSSVCEEHAAAFEFSGIILLFRRGPASTLKWGYFLFPIDDLHEDTTPSSRTRICLKDDQPASICVVDSDKDRRVHKGLLEKFHCLALVIRPLEDSCLLEQLGQRESKVREVFNPLSIVSNDT